MIQLLIFRASFPVLHSVGQLALEFQSVKTCFLLTLQLQYIQASVMPKPVYLLTVQEAHNEYNSLMDQIKGQVWTQASMD